MKVRAAEALCLIAAFGFAYYGWIAYDWIALIFSAKWLVFSSVLHAVARPK